MTITIQIEAPEDLKFMESLLLLMKQSGVYPRLNVKKTIDQKTPPAGITEKLHGIFSLPDAFDYKAFLSEEYLKDQRADG